MSTFQLKGDIVSYKYDSSTTEPTTDFSGKISISSSISSMSVDGTYTLYISTAEIGGDDIQNIIDTIDGVESDKKLPVKGSKLTPQIPSTRCSITSPRQTVVFDILYNTQSSPSNGGSNFLIFTIKVKELVVSGDFINNEILYFTYNFYGVGGNMVKPIVGGTYQQYNSSTLGGDGDIFVTASSGTLMSDVDTIYIYENDIDGVTLTSILDLPNTKSTDILLQIEGTQLINVYTITSSTKTSSTYEYSVTSQNSTGQNITTNDTYSVSLMYNGTSGTSGISGVNGNSSPYSCVNQKLEATTTTTQPSGLNFKINNSSFSGVTEVLFNENAVISGINVDEGFRSSFSNINRFQARLILTEINGNSYATYNVSSVSDETTYFIGTINNNVNNSGSPQIDSYYCINFQTEI